MFKQMQFALALGALGVLGAGSASASPLFVPDGIFQVQATNSPDTFTQNVALTPGTTLIDSGKVSLTISIVLSGADTWLVFKYATVNGGVLSQQNQNWAINHVGLIAAEPVNFTAAYVQFSKNGVAQTPTSNIFGGYSLMANPVPGETGNGFGASGFSGLFPAGPLPALGAFISPWNFLNSTGIDSSQVNGYEQALRFSSQNPVTAPEPASYALIAGGLAALAALRRRR